MINKILASLLIALIAIGTNACKNHETSSTTHEDSIKMAMMQARLDSMETALEQHNQAHTGEMADAGFTEAGDQRTGKNKPQRRFSETKRKVPLAGKNFFAKDMGNYPEGSSRLLTGKDIQHISAWGYKLMLNEIYARHGMSFTDRDLQNHFNDQPWYKTGRKNVDQSLSAIEKQNIEFLRNHPK